MSRYDARNSECRVFTRRAGLLGAIGHDLELGVREYAIELDEATLQLRVDIDARSVHVLDAVEPGARRPGRLSARLSARDKAEIDRHIAGDVLEAVRFPRIEFRSTRVEPEATGYRVYGRLSLHGLERDLSLLVRRRGDRLETEVVLHQPDFGLKPFKAFAGALRVHADVVVRVSLPAPAGI